jgi:hypothetical protein
MKNRYRIIYYVPTPNHESTYAVAALMERPEGIRLVVAKRTPCSCSFDKHVDHRPKINELLEKIALDLPNRIEMPLVFSKKIRVGAMKRYPLRVKDPIGWLRKFILPH